MGAWAVGLRQTRLKGGGEGDAKVLVEGGSESTVPAFSPL